jgi:concanavalin A-like lectin/glucanase superfamily protein
VSGSGNEGTVSGATWSIGGKYGGALFFDGVNDWATVADTPSLDLTNRMTIEAWVKPSALNDWMTVLMKERAGNLSYALYGRTDALHLNQPAGFANTGVDRIVRAGNPLPTGVWTHLAATYDGATFRLYVNGAQLDSIPLTESMVVGTGPLRLGGNGVWGEWFSGLIDDVRVYSRALSAAEIATDLNTPVG